MSEISMVELRQLAAMCRSWLRRPEAIFICILIGLVVLAMLLDAKVQEERADRERTNG